MKKLLNRMWGVWFLVTTLYSLSFFVLNVLLRKYDNNFTRIVGLFTPFGLLNFVIGFHEPLALLVGFGGIAISDAAIKKIKVNTFVKVLLCLSILFMLTYFVDMLIGGKWMSMELFNPDPKGFSF